MRGRPAGMTRQYNLVRIEKVVATSPAMVARVAKVRPNQRLFGM
jgi:hypothetical protein